MNAWRFMTAVLLLAFACKGGSPLTVGDLPTGPTVERFDVQLLADGTAACDFEFANRDSRSRSGFTVSPMPLQGPVDMPIPSVSCPFGRDPRVLVLMGWCTAEDVPTCDVARVPLIFTGATTLYVATAEIREVAWPFRVVDSRSVSFFGVSPGSGVVAPASVYP